MPHDASNQVDVQSFVSAYTPANEPRIRFAWNGKHAEEFDDANAWFRQVVKEAVLSDIDAAPIELVRDLFKAETECSREAWGIGEGVDVLAERLVRADPERFVEDYLAGKFQSFDAVCGNRSTRAWPGGWRRGARAIAARIAAPASGRSAHKESCPEIGRLLTSGSAEHREHGALQVLGQPAPSCDDPPQVRIELQ